MSVIKPLMLCLASLALAAAQTKPFHNVVSTTDKPDGSRSATGLTSGQAVSFTLPATNTGAVYNGTRSHSIIVPLGASQLQVAITTQPTNADVDIYVRFGSDILVVGDSGLFDYSSEGLSGSEVITIPNPAAGTYFIAYGLFTSGVTPTVTVLATVTGGSGACSYTLTPNTLTTIGSVGGNGSIIVNTTAGCTWTVVSDASWLRPTTFAGNGSGSVAYVVDANGGQERTARVTIAGQVFTLTQSGVLTGAAALPDNAMIVSQFVGGGTQWNTSLIITNFSNIAESFTVKFYDDAGLPKIMPMFQLGPVSTFTATLLPGETGRYETGINPNLQVAWAAIIPTNEGFQRFNGFAILRQSLPGNTSAEATVGFGNPRDSRQILFVDEVAPYATALALVNPDPSTLNLLVEARTEGGSPIASKTIQLPPFGHGIYFIATEFPTLVGRRGTIRFSAGSKGITGLGLRFGGTGGAFTSFPLLTGRDIQ